VTASRGAAPASGQPAVAAPSAASAVRAAAGAEEQIAALLLGLLLAVMLLQVFTRYVLNDPTAWTEEVCRYLYVYIVFLGASAAIADRSHVSVNVLTQMLPPGAQLAIALAVDVLIVAFLAILAWYGVRATVRNADIPLAVLQIPYAWVYAIVPLTALTMIGRTLWRMRDDVRRHREHRGVGEEGRAVI
jgi:TRAP-type C4-dicarboxylate transport system permease small subunit